MACGDRDLTGLLGTLEPTLELIAETFAGDEINEGDIIICNSPHEAGNHLNDVRMVKPLFHAGELIAFVANVGHGPILVALFPARSTRLPATRSVRGYGSHRSRSSTAACTGVMSRA